ncbi:DUF1501 domain-containing protein [Rhizobiaceae bacterium n13]|uniref:DUF1501 domain-containing protein n=1 Tax=Ferirhizobium litorale TaxID=2927786 RepID=A0AAE3QK99_9HYPH|nr:DUF1501 domain-containing protein [Fererhizobium litorale]MDI7864920.1 DUF1501 domain-containing protein [Fererhizobium litorale]MDI7925040.1 DUF1501 domain-containing protein [Fererhizobium litorale]
MEQPFTLTRRSLLIGGCCAAAAPLLTPVTFAAMPGDNRFVTIVLRGAMDGLDLVQPHGDPALKQLRPDLALSPDDGLIDLDGFFGLNPVASDLMPLWKAGELSFVHAVSTPYRDARSHFDGQDMLETGEETLGGTTSGWLNRSLSVIPGATGGLAIDVNMSSDLILNGPNPVSIWSTRSDLAIADDELQFLKRLYQNDPAFAAAITEATRTDATTDSLYGDARRAGGAVEVAKLVGAMLLKEYRISNFSINGWDTHVGQKVQFPRAARQLVRAIVTLKETLGEAAWNKTAVLAMTEFGRTVRQNGSKGTDHGTGGCCILAGGAVNGGKVFGKWPGLGPGKLLDDRDLMPTGDVRAVAAAMLYRQFGVRESDLTGTVFPGLTLDRNSPLLRS